MTNGKLTWKPLRKAW